MAVRTRGHCAHRLIEALESRLLMTTAFANADMAGTWAVDGNDVGGSMIMNGAGAVTGGTLSFVTGGAAVTGNGTYALDPAGGVTFTNTQFTRSGTVSSTKDFAAITQTTGTIGFTLMAKHTIGGFSNASLSGTWSIFVNGNTTDSTGSGVLTFDGNGVITAGDVKSTKGDQKVTAGTYSVDANGVLALSVTLKGENGPITYQGALNDSGDLAVIGTTNLIIADQVSHTPLEGILVRHTAANFSNADMVGVWETTIWGGHGAVTFDGKGKFAGTLDTTQGATPFSGTYAVSKTGSVTYVAHWKVGAQTFVYSNTAALNDSKNEMTSVQLPKATGFSSVNSMTLFVRSDYTPQLTKVKTTETAIENVPLNISYATFASHTDVLDRDGDTTHFIIESVTNGTVKVNNVTVVPGTTTYGVGDTLTWTPTAGSSGNVAAFTIRASDALEDSGKDLAVVFKTIKRPVVSITSTPTAKELGSVAAKFTIACAGGDLKSSLTVDYSIGGSAANNGTDFTPQLFGSVVIPALKPNVVITIAPVDDFSIEGTETVLLTVTTDAGNTYTITPVVKMQSATVSIADHNRPPTLTTVTTIPNGVKNTPLAISYATLFGATDAVDPESVAIQFKITGIVGTLLKNGVAVHGTTTVAAGDTLTWTPGLNKTGAVTAFSIAAFDGVNTSKSKAVKVQVT